MPNIFKPIFGGTGYDRYARGTGYIQVLTNGSSFSSEELKMMNNSYARLQPDKRQPIAGPSQRVLGATFSFGVAGFQQVSPYVNYLANNPPSYMSSDFARLVQQVHELGHSLADITGRVGENAGSNWKTAYLISSLNCQGRESQKGGNYRLVLSFGGDSVQERRVIMWTDQDMLYIVESSSFKHALLFKRMLPNL